MFFLFPQLEFRPVVTETVRWRATFSFIEWWQVKLNAHVCQIRSNSVFCLLFLDNVPRSKRLRSLSHTTGELLCALRQRVECVYLEEGDFAFSAQTCSVCLEPGIWTCQALPTDTHRFFLDFALTCFLMTLINSNVREECRMISVDICFRAYTAVRMLMLRCTSAAGRCVAHCGVIC